MENKKKKTLVIVLGIFALVIVTTAASFAFFTYSKTGTTTSTIISGDIEFSFIEGKSATLANAFPVADSVGAVDTTGEYEFDVKLTSSSNANKMNYNVLLVDNNDDADTYYFNNDQIKFSLVKNNTYVANTSSTSGVKLSDIDGFNELSNQGEGIVLEDQEITAGTTDNYKLRIWISDDVNYSNTIDGQDNQESIGKYNSYKYSLKVKVTSGVSTDPGTSDLTINTKVNNLSVKVDIEAENGISAYAVTQTPTAPEDDSNEWIDLTSTAKSNVVRTSNAITKKTINYIANDNGKHYIHVKDSNNKIATKSFTINVDEKNAAFYIMKLAKTNTNELRIDKHESTGQQDFSVTEYRYWGVTPNNYVEFNNELWRIIGAMDVDDGQGNVEKRLKIIRAVSIGTYSYDSSAGGLNSGKGVNEWSQADLMVLLNSGLYYNRTSGKCYAGSSNATTACDFTETGLTTEAKEMIGNAKWYLGAAPENHSSLKVDGYYKAERGTLIGKECSSGLGCNDEVERTTSWTGEIGLMYPSDYGYSADLEACSKTVLHSYSGSCRNTTWLYKKPSKWTMTPAVYEKQASHMMIAHEFGHVTDYAAYNRGFDVYPTTYLKSNIQIVDGIGTDGQPFILNLYN